MVCIAFDSLTIGSNGGALNLGETPDIDVVFLNGNTQDCHVFAVWASFTLGKSLDLERRLVKVFGLFMKVD